MKRTLSGATCGAYNVAMTAQMRNLFGGVVLISAVLLGGITLACSGGDSNENKQSTTTAHPSAPANGTPVDPKVVALTEARKAARENYINKMREIFMQQGVNANIIDSNGVMVIVSDALKESSDRNQFMRTTFDPTYRKALCAAGFTAIELRSGAILGDGATYSLGCPESKEERAARLQARAAKRQEFVAGLQNDFKSDADLQEIQVTQTSEELVITSPSFKGMPPQQMRAMFDAQFDQQNNACGLGFKGLRVKTGPSSAGTFISYNCPK
jgi:uncharacterized protein YnzC (UPF0291/DUF896 family)